jgi:hypothetical protein
MSQITDQRLRALNNLLAFWIVMIALPQFKDHPQTQNPPNRYLLSRPTTLKPQSVVKAVTVETMRMKL